MKTALKLRYESITTLLTAYTLSRLHDYKHLMQMLENFNVSNDEYRAWLRHEMIEGRRHNPKNLASYSEYYCPDCGSEVEVLEVNTMPCNMVGEGYQSMFSCKGYVACGYTRYSEDPVSKWTSLLSRAGRDQAGYQMRVVTKGCGGCGGK